MDALLDLLQWPAMVVTVLASWLVASTHEARRNVGFWLFLASTAEPQRSRGARAGGAASSLLASSAR